MDLRERLALQGPKRILSLDGGGFRSVIMIGFLERIEQILRERHQNPNLRLCEYFDLIGGTSTGAIIAGALSVGMEAAQLKKVYLKLAKRNLGKRKWWKLWELFYKHGPLENELKKLFGDVALGSPEIKTGLCIVTKRADINSHFLFINHPRDIHFSKYSNMMLRRIIRASIGVRRNFLPEQIDLQTKESESWLFVDGGLGIANNPALRMFLVAVLQGYPFRWPIGDEKLLLVSLGTGFWQHRLRVDQSSNKITGRSWMDKIPFLLMDETSRYNQMMLQYLSRSDTPWEIDREVGNLMLDLLTPDPALTYLRYDVQLEKTELQNLGFSDVDNMLESIRDMKVPKNREILLHIGEQAGKQKVLESHFPKIFDLSHKESFEGLFSEKDR